MVSYVLLIVIAVGLSVAVYSYLNLYVPKEKPQCSADISLIVQDYQCTSNPNGGTLNITFLNKGLFSIDAVYVRVGSSSAKVKQQINPGNGIYFGVIGGQKGLVPGKIVSKFFGSPYINNADLELEIQPAVFSGNTNNLALCDQAIITQPIKC